MRGNGSWKLEVGGWKLEVGGWKLEVGGWKLEVGSWKLSVPEVNSGQVVGYHVPGCKLQVAGFLINNNIQQK